MKKFKSNIKEDVNVLREMAQIGIVDNIIIQVYGNEHNPIHFHAIKKDCYDVRIDVKTFEIISYKWQKKEMDSSDIKKIKKWLVQPNKKNTKLSNKDGILFAWNIMNNL